MQGSPQRVSAFLAGGLDFPAWAPLTIRDSLSQEVAAEVLAEWAVTQRRLADLKGAARGPVSHS